MDELKIYNNHFITFLLIKALLFISMVISNYLFSLFKEQIQSKYWSKIIVQSILLIMTKKILWHAIYN